MSAVISVTPARKSDSISHPDDPAIWIHPADSSKSLIIGTNKTTSPQGGLAVYGLDGKLIQMAGPLDRPNNVDVGYGLRLAGRRVDIVAATERNRQALRIYRVDAATRRLEDAGDIRVFEGEPGESALPMGVALYRRPRDGALFAIVSRKSGPAQGYLWQYRLEDDGHGRVTGRKVRAFGNFSQSKEIEAIAVDHELGFVYYADEDTSIHKWHADPDHKDADRELLQFGKGEFAGNREGIAIYAKRGGKGYLICTDQKEGNSEYRIYERSGAHKLLAVISGGLDSTDGIEVTSRPLGPDFPAGLLVAMDNREGNFHFFDWRAIAGAARLR